MKMLVKMFVAARPNGATSRATTPQRGLRPKVPAADAHAAGVRVAERARRRGAPRRAATRLRGRRADVRERLHGIVAYMRACGRPRRAGRRGGPANVCAIRV